MNKVKVIENKTIEKEVDLEYPIYLYFQDEDCHDEYVMVTDGRAIIIKNNHFGFTVELTSCYYVRDYYIPRNITKKEHFDEAYKEAIAELNRKVNL